MEKTRSGGGLKKRRVNGDKQAKADTRVGKLNMVFAEKPFLNPEHPPAPKFKSLKQVVNIEKNQKNPIDAPTYWKIESPPSAIPEKKYCDITGLEAPYVDPQTSLRYHNADVYQFIRTLRQQHIQGYLELRRAALDLRS